MTLRWEDERYVRFYTRNTPEWLSLSWQARGLFGLILRESDRAGILRLGKTGLRGISVVIHSSFADIEAPLQELLEDGCIKLSEDGTTLVVPNYIEAQETPQSDVARKRKSREAARSTLCVTNRDQNVTHGHVESQEVTSSHSVPSVPSVPSGSVASPSASATEVDPGQQSLIGVYVAPVSKPDKSRRQRETEPMPFTVTEAIAMLRDSSKGAFIADPFDSRLSPAITTVIRKFPVADDWHLVGEWLASGGMSWRKSPPDPSWLASVGAMASAIGQSKAWKDGNANRPSIGGSAASSSRRYPTLEEIRARQNDPERIRKEHEEWERRQGNMGGGK